MSLHSLSVPNPVDRRLAVRCNSGEYDIIRKIAVAPQASSENRIPRWKILARLERPALDQKIRIVLCDFHLECAIGKIVIEPRYRLPSSISTQFRHQPRALARQRPEVISESAKRRADFIDVSARAGDRHGNAPFAARPTNS